MMQHLSITWQRYVKFVKFKHIVTFFYIKLYFFVYFVQNRMYLLDLV